MFGLYPNITGTGAGDYLSREDKWTGCMSANGNANIGGFEGRSGGIQFVNVTVDASRSSSAYGSSQTIQPPSLRVLPCIKF